MAAKDLITLARAKQAILAITDTTYDALLQTLITAVSDAIEKYCCRDFYVRSYDELYSGNGDRRLLLREYPIQSIQSVRYRPVTVLKVINNDMGLIQQARVTVSSTGLTLVSVASGVSSSTALAFAGNATLQALATAINALGNGWSAQVVGDPGSDYGLWPSADLYVPPSYGDGTTSQGALTTRGQFAELKLHTYELAGYQFDPRGWLLRAIPYTDPELLHPEDLIWPVGINNFRVQYSAGFQTIPESVQEACARWVAICWNLAQRDPNLTRQDVAQAIHQIWDTIDPDHQPPRTVRALLAPYRRHTVNNNQG
jgi:hypothetical protein